MRRDKMTRKGCDGCKVDTGTYGFDHYGDIKLWLCETCLARLLDWPKTISTASLPPQWNKDAEVKVVQP